MPTVTLNRSVFEKLVGIKLSDEQLKDRISMLGTALENLSHEEIVVEVFPNRPDMLSEQGFARAFSAFIGTKPGSHTYTAKKSGTYTKIEKVLEVWPHAVTCLVKGLKLNDEKIREIIQLQEKLGITLLRNRKKGGLGIYPLDKIKTPITFTTRNAEDILFRPLEYPHSINGREILAKHPTGKRYGHIIEKEKEFPIFVDAEGTIMSMPPIINSHDVGKISESTTEVFVEATGPNLHILTIALMIFVTALADMGGSIYSMEIKYPKKIMTVPDFTPRKMTLDISYPNRILGLTLKEAEVKKFLEQMGYEYKNKIVSIPPYRADILHPIDLVEDIGIAYGYENIDAEIPRVATIAEEAPLNRFITRITELLIGAGCQEVRSYHLISYDELCTKMSGVSKPILLKNAPEDYSCLRNSIIPSILKILAQNQHHDYPQHVFEVGTVFYHDSKSSEKTREQATLTIALCDEKADLTSIRQIVDLFSRSLELSPSITELEHPSFIQGRAASAAIEGKQIAVFGEINPQVLANWGLVMPVAALEIDLDSLFAFVQQSESKKQ